MKKLIAILAAVVMACAFAPMASADGVETIEVTLTPNASANITCNRTAWAPGCGLGEQNRTSQTWGNLDNSGTVSVGVTIQGENTAAWTIHDTTAAHNQFLAEFYVTGWEGYDADAETFDAGIAYDESVNFGLGVDMPDSTSVSATQYFTITFTATAL